MDERISNGSMSFFHSMFKFLTEDIFCADISGFSGRMIRLIRSQKILRACISGVSAFAGNNASYANTGFQALISKT